jgi:hypothetical protein
MRFKDFIAETDDKHFLYDLHDDPEKLDHHDSLHNDPSKLDHHEKKKSIPPDSAKG